MGVKPESYINDFPLILKEQDYTDAMYRWGSETNGLENMVYHNLKSISNKVYYESNNDFIELSNKYLKHYDFSRVEYFTILPVKRTNNKFVIWFSVNNSTDSRIMDVFIDDVLLETINIDGNNKWFKTIDFKDKNYKITAVFFDKDDILKENVIEVKEIILTPDYFYNKLQNNGYIEFK